ncbi:MAG: hypothetical protein GY781_19995 [Gammaproteobacteria bacterium]|nr:hypothetical protein [Gammaproteobacteria bacterium]
MRSLMAVLYILILGCLLIASYVVELMSEDSYEQYVGEEYLHYSSLITLAIEQRLKMEMLNKTELSEIDDLLSFWQEKAKEELVDLQMVDKPVELTIDMPGIVSRIKITDISDKLTIIAPIKHQQYKNKALRFSYVSSYSESELFFYYMSTLAIYFMLAIIISFIAWAMYRYINQISRVTQSVAAGNFNLKMPPNRISALQKLSSDINTMANTIEDKTTENLILTGAIHHELRIPITRIRLALDMALQGDSNAELKELLSGMDNDLVELSSLTEEILAISRLRLSSVNVEKEDLYMPSLLEDLIETLDTDIVTNKVCESFTLNGNRVLIERAILNIIYNAIKYAEQKVVVSAQKQANQFVLSIDDDGPGIPADKRKLVLKPFYRTDRSRNRKTGGFGLGLAIANMVLKETEGKIEISDSELGGTQVNLIWPIVEE